MSLVAGVVVSVVVRSSRHSVRIVCGGVNAQVHDHTYESSTPTSAAEVAAVPPQRPWRARDTTRDVVGARSWREGRRAFQRGHFDQRHRKRCA